MKYSVFSFFKVLLFLSLFVYSDNSYAQLNREIIDFNKDWLFFRFGLQHDETRIPEPGSVFQFSIAVSSEAIESGNAPQQAMDNNEATCWQPSKDDQKPWLLINLNKPVFIHDCKINATGDYKSVLIEGSNDKITWKELPGNFEFIKVTFEKDDTNTGEKTKKQPVQVFEVILSDNQNQEIKNSLFTAQSPEEPDFNDKQWRRLDLPHDWGIEGSFRNSLDGYTGKLPWRGIGWYRKSFKVESQDKGKKIYLDLDGAMANAEVYLNGIKVGERPYGYIPFRVDLTPAIRFNESNTIAIRLNTEKMGSRWYPGAGIYRNVKLVKTNLLHIPQWSVFISTPEINEQYATAAIMVQIANEEAKTAKGFYQVEIYELDKNEQPGQMVAMSNKKDFTIQANTIDSSEVRLQVEKPKLWNLEQTNRYLARVHVYDDNKETDVYDAPFGFRTIEFTHDNGFLLNGKRVQLKGVCMHHDLGALGAAVNVSAMERQIRILKSFGANAIRTSHNPPATELLTLADKMGMLILDEVFDCWASGKNANDYSVLYSEWHQKDIQALVCRDRNHPSVIMWSLGNEVREQYYPEQGVAAHLRQIVKQYDTTRPVTFGASYPSKSALNGTELQIDVHGMNYPSGVYGGPDFYGTFLNYKGHEHISGYASETSSTISSRGIYFPGETFQVSSYDLKEPGWGSLPDHEFAALEKYPAIAGEFVWTGFDYLGEPTPFNSDISVLLNHATLNSQELEKARQELDKIEKSRPSSRSSYFGIVDLAGFPKDRYYLYKAHWQSEVPMVHILPHWNFEDRLGQVIPVFVYSSGDEVELFLNGKSLGKKKKGAYEYRFRWDDVIYTPGELKAIAYKDGKDWAKSVVKTTGAPKKLQLSAEKNRITAQDDELAFVTVSICDESGNVVPTANNYIVCKLEGDGVIVATDNGDATSLVPFSSHNREAFSGLLLVILKAKPDAKNSLILTVESEGIESSSIEISVDSDSK